MSSLVITSPHSLCPEGVYERHCDLLAYLAATRLLKVLQPQIQADYCPATRFRDQTNYREELRRGFDF